MTYSTEIRNQAIDLYKKGLFISKIAEMMEIPFGTLAGWIYSATYTEAERAFIEQEHYRQRVEIARTKTTPGKQESLHSIRENAYECGLNSQRTPVDNFCIGLYEADGAKGRHGSSASPIWEFINSNRNYIQAMVAWAIRAGQPSSDFTARVYIHENLPVTEEEVKAYWTEAGIPYDHIHVHKEKLREGRKDRTGRPHRTPWGTCHLSALKNLVWLYWFWRGQKDQLEESGVARQESIVLLERLRKGEAVMRGS
jgi:hypothetical protein